MAARAFSRCNKAQWYRTRCLTKQNLCPRFSRARVSLRQIARVRFARVRLARVRFARARIARVRFAGVKFARVRFASVNFSRHRSGVAINAHARTSGMHIIEKKIGKCRILAVKRRFWTQLPIDLYFLDEFY